VSFPGESELNPRACGRRVEAHLSGPCYLESNIAEMTETGAQPVSFCRRHIEELKRAECAFLSRLRPSPVGS